MDRGRAERGYAACTSALARGSGAWRVRGVWRPGRRTGPGAGRSLRGVGGRHAGISQRKRHEPAAPHRPSRGCAAHGTARLRRQPLRRRPRSRALDGGGREWRRLPRRARGRQDHALARCRRRRRGGVSHHVRRRSRPAARSRHRGRLSLCRHTAPNPQIRVPDRPGARRFTAAGGHRRGRARQRARALDPQHRVLGRWLEPVHSGG